ncbi:MAG: lipocalin family protein [Cyclobacteriaceae bacterium]
MKKLLFVLMAVVSLKLQAQSVVGTWQLVEEQTCLQVQFEKSETEKELEQSMGSSKNAVAKLIRFDKKETGEEGIFSQGNKKGTGMSSFRYNVKGNELRFLDKKSGIISQRFVIDELTESTLKIHNAMKDCEVRFFSRVK